MTGMYGWTVVYGLSRELQAAGFGHLVRQPFLLDGNLRYATTPNQFLIDRGLGVWDLKWRGKKPVALPPSAQSLKNLAYWLCNAQEWAELRSVDLLRCDYSTVLIGRYQKEMLSGMWSANGKPLRASTANLRVGAALEFQMWAADKGLRSTVAVPTVTTTYVAPSHSNSRSHERETVESRQGKVRVRPRSLAFPSEAEIDAWRKRIQHQPVNGVTEGLIVDLIINTAIRREEAACWRVDTLPILRRDWRIANPDQEEEHQTVLVELRYGTKGPEYGFDHDDKIGPTGEIHVPLAIANRIDAYRNGPRLAALRVAVRRATTAAAQRAIRDNAVHLFLHEETGQRYHGKQIYSLWRKGDGPPHWSPHAARHWWACRYLERRMLEHAQLIQHVLATPGLSAQSPLMLALRNSAESVIQLAICPQLRHARQSTTQLYLQWLFVRLEIPISAHPAWNVDSDDGDEAEGADEE